MLLCSDYDLYTCIITEKSDITAADIIKIADEIYSDRTSFG